MGFHYKIRQQVIRIKYGIYIKAEVNNLGPYIITGVFVNSYPGYRHIYVSK
jgi:hypothetical protein